MAGAACSTLLWHPGADARRKSAVHEAESRPSEPLLHERRHSTVSLPVSFLLRAAYVWLRVALPCFLGTPWLERSGSVGGSWASGDRLRDLSGPPATAPNLSNRGLGQRRPPVPSAVQFWSVACSPPFPSPDARWRSGRPTHPALVIWWLAVFQPSSP